MVSCAACGCSSTKNNKALNITFHRFPKCEPRRSVWVRFVSTPGWVPKQGSVLCSQHFSKECFDKSSKLRLRLWPTAVPTIEVHHLKYTPNPVPKHPTGIVQIPSNLPGPSNLLQTPPYSLQLPDTPQEHNLKRKIEELQQRARLKDAKIRNLQKLMLQQQIIPSLHNTILFPAKVQDQGK